MAAFFDMDGTLLSSNVIETYLWMRLQDLSTAERASEIGRIAARLPGLVRAERRERSAFLRSIYREYEGARLERPRRGGRRVPHRPRAGPARAGRRTPGPRAPRRRPPDGPDHRRDPAADPPAGAAVRPHRGGRAGRRRHAAGAPASWPRRRWSASPGPRGCAQWAAANGIDLAASYGYADSYSDLPLLEAVGNPVAVRPDVALFRHARKLRWNIVDWPSSPSTARTLNPAGDRG